MFISQSYDILSKGVVILNQNCSTCKVVMTGKKMLQNT